MTDHTQTPQLTPGAQRLLADIEATDPEWYDGTDSDRCLIGQVANWRFGTDEGWVYNYGRDDLAREYEVIESVIAEIYTRASDHYHGHSWKRAVRMARSVLRRYCGE